MGSDNVGTGRHPGCESSNHEVCNGELWQCSQCGKWVCCAEGTTDDPELCDDCWMRKHHPEEAAHEEDGSVDPSFVEPTTPAIPDWDTLTRWMWDGVAEATDGCRVESDGTCPHGHHSWLIELGLI